MTRVTGREKGSNREREREGEKRNCFIYDKVISDDFKMLKQKTSAAQLQRFSERGN